MTPDPRFDSPAFRLSVERLRLGLFLDEMAAIGCVAPRTQSRYENQHRSPDIDYLARVASHGADVQYIVTGVRSVNLDSVAQQLAGEEG